MPARLGALRRRSQHDRQIGGLSGCHRSCPAVEHSGDRQRPSRPRGAHSRGSRRRADVMVFRSQTARFSFTLGMRSVWNSSRTRFRYGSARLLHIRNVGPRDFRLPGHTSSYSLDGSSMSRGTPVFAAGTVDRRQLLARLLQRRRSRARHSNTDRASPIGVPRFRAASRFSDDGVEELIARAESGCFVVVAVPNSRSKRPAVCSARQRRMRP